jgi:hypothetical protein
MDPTKGKKPKRKSTTKLICKLQIDRNSRILGLLTQSIRRPSALQTEALSNRIKQGFRLVEVGGGQLSVVSI